MNKNYATINGNQIDVTTVMDKTVQYNPTMEEATHIVKEAENLLGTYFDCLNDGAGLWTMFCQSGLFWKAKGWLISAMKSYPFYNGNYQIVLRDQEMCRRVNRADINGFYYYATDFVDEVAMYENTETGEVITKSEREDGLEHWRDLMYKWGYAANSTDYPIYIKAVRYAKKKMSWLRAFRKQKLYIFVNEALSDTVKTAMSSVLVTDELAKEIENKAEYYGVDFRGIQEGQKISRLFQKICKLVNMHKHVDIRDTTFIRQDGEVVERKKDFGWNYQYAKLCDAINPLVIKGTAVISVNPYDFWTMSFGKGWASCHTIDKENRRNNNHNYSGCYCGGTESYMLDDSSVIFYFLEGNFTGDHPEYEDKYKRCVFYLGEDKIIQSRLYPDGRDGGDESIAGDARRIMQKVISDIFNVPNYWDVKHGIEAACDVIWSHGPHYRDYEHYSDVNVSFMKRIDGYKNENAIDVGRKIICPNCGKEHYSEENIFCGKCLSETVECAECGNDVDEEYAYLIGGQYYCSNCVEYCNGCHEYHLIRETHDTNRGRRCGCCVYNYYEWSEYDDQYVHEADIVSTEEGHIFSDDSDGWRECDSCHEIHDYDKMKYDRETELWYCESCYNRLIERRNAETE